MLVNNEALTFHPSCIQVVACIYSHIYHCWFKSGRILDCLLVCRVVIHLSSRNSPMGRQTISYFV